MSAFSATKKQVVTRSGTRSVDSGAAPFPPSLPGNSSRHGPVAALEVTLPASTQVPVSESKEAHLWEMATSPQEVPLGYAELLSRVSLLEERCGFVELELSHSREIERKANDALLKCLALEAHFALRVPPLHSPMGQESPKLSIIAEEEPQLLSVKAENSQARKGKRQNKPQGPRDPDRPSSDSDSDSDDPSPPGGSFPIRGPSSPGLQEIIPSRSGYRKLVSYRSYRLDNLSQRYDGTISKRLSALMKGLRHTVEEKFTGEDPIEILSFLRSFKEGADHMDISEGAAARLLPYFLDGIAREEYRSHMGRAPPEVDIYPYMIQFLLSRFAVDEVLVEAYLGVTQCKALEGEPEQAYGRRLYKAAIRAGNVVSMEDLATLFTEGLPSWVQTGIRDLVTPGLSYDRVVRLAHNFGTSLRQADLSGGTPKTKPMTGIKPITVKIPRTGSVGICHTEASGSGEESDHTTRGEKTFTLQELEVALASARAEDLPGPVSAPGTSSPSWYATPPSCSPPASVVYIPSRGWASPAGSVRAEPILPRGGVLSRPGIRRPPLCYVCYQFGHWLADCPSVPVELRRMAQQNREDHLRANPPPPPRGTPAYSQYGNANTTRQVLYTEEDQLPEPGESCIPGILPDGRSAWPPVEGGTQQSALVAETTTPNWGMTPERAENDQGGN